MSVRWITSKPWWRAILAAAPVSTTAIRRSTAAQLATANRTRSAEAWARQARWSASKRADSRVLALVKALIGTTTQITPLFSPGPSVRIAAIMAQAELHAPEIPEDWLNDHTQYQKCFVCGRRNYAGLDLYFRQEADEIVTDFTGKAEHQGFPGVVHGGLLATILDETMGRTALFSRTWVMTGRLEVRFRNPAPLGVRMTCPARLTCGP